MSTASDPSPAPNAAAHDGHYRLPDGLHITALRRPGSGAGRSFAAALTCRSGFRFDPEDARGLCHLIEHLAFKGPNKTLVQSLARRGVNVNAWTELERTVFWTAGPVAAAAEAVAFLRGLVDPAPHAAADVRSEIDVLEQEQAGRPYTPWDYERDLMFGNIVGVPGGWLGSITMADALRKLPLERVNKAAAEALRPGNCWLTVVSPDPLAHAGDTSGARAAEPDPLSEDIPEGDPPPLPRCVLRHFKKAPQTTVARSFHFRPPAHYRGAAIAVMCDLLGGGPHSEVYRALREQESLAYDTGLAALHLHDCAVYTLHAAVHPDNAARTLAILNSLVARVRAEGFPREQLEEARARMAHGLESLDDDTDQLCGFLASRALGMDHRPPRLPMEHAARLAELDLSEVNTVAAAVMRPERTITVVNGHLKWWRRRKLGRLAVGG